MEGGAEKFRRWRASRKSDFTGHRRVSAVGRWPTRSPRAVFFWSVNVRDAEVSAFTSFKGTAVAQCSPAAVVKCMSRSRKASEREARCRSSFRLEGPQNSAGRMSQKNATMNQTCDLNCFR